MRGTAPEPETRKLLADEFRRIVWTFIHEAPRMAHGLRVGEMTSAVTPWQHQVRTLYTVPNPVAEQGVNRRRSGPRQDNLGWPDPPASNAEWLGETGADPDTQERPDSMAKRTVREVQPQCPDLRWRGALLETGSWRDKRQREVRFPRRSGRLSRSRLYPVFLMRRADRQRELLDAADWDLIILDEAHHARRRGSRSTQEKGPNKLLG